MPEPRRRTRHRLVCIWRRHLEWLADSRVRGDRGSRDRRMRSEMFARFGAGWEHDETRIVANPDSVVTIDE